MVNKLVVFLLILSLGCKKNTIHIQEREIPAIEKYSWTEAIDSLKGQYFQGIDVSANGELFVNVWKQGSPRPDPVTLISRGNGQTWQSVNPIGGLPETWTYIQRNANKLFAGTPDAGLFVSADNGLTWQPEYSVKWKWPEVIKSNQQNLVISDFRLEETYLSADNGASWRMIYPSFLRVVSLSASELLAVNRGVVLQSTNLGSSWLTDSSLVRQLGGRQGSLGIERKEDSLIVALNSGIFIKKAFSSDPWQSISSAIRNPIGLFFKAGDLMIIQEQFSNTMLYSYDYGRNWRTLGYVSGRLWNMVKLGKYLVASGENGLFKKQIED